ncbi:hypothetical protein GCM10010415_13910 [Streptomyces atrovirens]|uniref:Uncharacterized protein n=1 Tax=Streptomyces atrovirens TaxID=285556 RepID=A0ABW0DSV1_9ACTN
MTLPFSTGPTRMTERDGRSPRMTTADPIAGVRFQPGDPQRAGPSGPLADEHAVRTGLALAGPAGVAARIRRDFSEEITAPGGIVVPNDFGDPGRPGIEEALDKHLTGGTRFARLGEAARSAFLRAP